MKLEKLSKEAVRSARKIDDVVHLSTEELRRVVGGGSTLEEVDPETCAIHFYYPADSVG